MYLIFWLTVHPPPLPPTDLPVFEEVEIFGFLVGNVNSLLYIHFKF